MCGIIGYIGSKNKTLDVLITGLTNLEYRGYDSVGIAYRKDNDVLIEKSIDRIDNLKKTIDFSVETELGIGHTRWATHGGVSLKNSHPHRVGKITLVHNGIVENYEELRRDLYKQKYEFKSETDSEVACALIDLLYKKTNNVLESIKRAINLIKGSYAFLIMVDGDDKLYVAKNKSPMIIGVGNREHFVASDVPAILDYTNKYYVLDDKEYGVITKENIEIFNNGVKKERELKVFEDVGLATNKNGYDHFMLKEIFEQPAIFKRNMQTYASDIENGIIDIPDLSKYKRINIVACGSAYHAGLVGKNLIESIAKTEVVVEIASEYRYKNYFNNDNTLVVAISQSGETADTLAAIEIAKENGCDTLAIVNVVDSTIARAADIVLYTNAGPEIAVATTKAYMAQVMLLTLVALKLGITKKLISIDDSLVKEINELPFIMEKLLNQKDLYKSIACELYKSNDIYFLGRKIDYAISLEASLKLKEISYLHSEAYAAGELKHGTISLIDNGTPVFGIITDLDIALKTVSNIKEVKARGAKTIVLTLEGQNVSADYVIEIPKVNTLLQQFLTIIPLQCVAYETAKLVGSDIDKPKNLAKSVTVE